MKIQETVRKTGVSVSTLRYYEELGLLTPRRTESRYWDYCEQDILWIEFILRLKKTGMNIKEIIHYSHLRNQGNTTLAERLALLDRQQLKLPKQSEEIRAHIHFIEHKKQIYRNMMKDDVNAQP